jgi:hypothetical protein
MVKSSVNLKITIEKVNLKEQNNVAMYPLIFDKIKKLNCIYYLDIPFFITIYIERTKKHEKK